VGVFASDRPDNSFNATVLGGQARTLYQRFSQEWQKRTGRAASESGISGFSSAWALFHHVLPQASSLDAAGIAAAARMMDLPEGSLPNGAGLRFAADGAQLGQNLRAAAVIWQWQAVRHSVVVWPPEYATGTVAMVPLPR
jgi:branched-chain amino acid transport system substrate-binding protein